MTEKEAKIDFNGQVAIITGAGRGLGKSHALELAKRGAKVVVNDFGGELNGTGSGTSPADEVVEEIIAQGGEAVANYDSVASVEGGERIVQTAINNFGKVDILINNAGVLRDSSFHKMDEEAWDMVLSVHLKGAYCVTRPAFTNMREHGYGRIVMTTSAAGLYGNFGQANYGSAKMGLIGLMNTLKSEGEKRNIKVNTISPMAASRMTQNVFEPEFLQRIKPELVSLFVLYLCSKECPVSGGIYHVGMGCFGRVAILTAPLVKLAEPDEMLSLEDIRYNWDKINSLDRVEEIHRLSPEFKKMM